MADNPNAASTTSLVNGGAPFSGKVINAGVIGTDGINARSALTGQGAAAFVGTRPASPPGDNQGFSQSDPYDADRDQVLAAVDASSLGVTGAGITVGVLSDSFNNLGGAAADEADGALPQAADVDLLRDLGSGGTDEGRAMMQIVHDIAPAADLDFYTADISAQQFADGILALAAAGCKVICDDVTYFDEPFFQTGIIAQAIATVEQEGVIYLTAAGNDAENGYQAQWNPIDASFDGTTLEDTQNFGGSGNSPEIETVKIGDTNGTSVPLVFEWNQPYGSATSDLEVLVFKNGRLYGTATNDSATGSLKLAENEANNPCIIVDLPGSEFGNVTYQIAIENLSGSADDPGLIGEISEADGYPITISVANAGTVQGHHMSPDAITVGAVDAGNTPGNGGTLESEPFSSSGEKTQLWFNFNGTTIAGAPIDLQPVAISGVDDVETSVSGDLSDFFGTSAATPSVAAVVALILQDNPALTFSEVKNILEDTATAFGNEDVAGAGLVDAAAAVTSASEAPGPVAGRVITGAYTNAGTTASIIAANASFSGNIVNTGTITANGITVSNSTIAGAIDDGGVISGGIGVNDRSKLIDAGGAGIAVAGPNFLGNISNGGTISSGTRTGVDVFGVTTFQGGIDNTGSIAGVTAVAVRQTATFLGVILNNAGGRIGAGAAGIELGDDATFWGGIENNSVITVSAGVGIEVDDVASFQGQVDNISGTIAAATGIRIVDSTIAGAIADTGTIAATSRGIAVDSASRIVALSSTAAILVAGPTLTGGISNCGTVSAGATGIFVHSASRFSGGITNGGTIIGGTTGIAVSTVAVFNSAGAGGGITNTGAIAALGDNGIRVHIGSTFIGDIVNSGTISAAATGIELFSISTFTGAISNFGIISGMVGIAASATSSVSIFDSGEIVGSGGTAVEFADGTNTFTLGPGYNISGEVLGGGSDIFRLGGSGSGGFDLAAIGSGGQYQGFAVFDVVGATWTLTGSGARWNVDGGTLQIPAGATLTDTTVSSGGVLALFAGGTLSGSTTVSSGGTLTVLSGGLADSATVYRGASESVGSGGTDFGARISGGVQEVLGYGSGATVFTGSQLVAAGGSASGTVVGGGEQFLYGYAGDTTVLAGSQVVETGGSASGTVVMAGGSEIVGVGGSAGGIVISGGTAELSSDAIVSGIIVATNGTIGIGGSGASLLSFMSSLFVSGLGPGDTVDLTNVAFASGATVSASGNGLYVSVGETLYDLTLGTQISAADLTVGADGAEGTEISLTFTRTSHSVLAGQTYSDSTVTDVDDVVHSGGTMFILSGAIATSTTVDSGGILVLEAGGTEIGLINSGTILADGGVISAGGGVIINDGVLDPGGTLPGVGGGGTTTLASTVNSGSTPTRLPADGVALLGSYMAAMFASAEGQVNIAGELQESETVLGHLHAARV